jgi:hypothetical protein
VRVFEIASIINFLKILFFETRLGIRKGIGNGTFTTFTPMKIFHFLPSLLFLTLIIACSSSKQTASSDKQLAALFSRAQSVQILSYADRTYHKSVIDSEKQKSLLAVDTSTIRVGKLPIRTRDIIDNLTITKAQRDSLFNLLHSDMCLPGRGSICYNPRHAILFYDSNNKPFGYIEFCFECTQYQTGPEFELDFCYEKVEALEKMFKNFGVTFFERGEM